MGASEGVSRRGLLRRFGRWAAGGAAALAVTGKDSSPAGAATGEPLILGAANTTGDPTSVTNGQSTSSFAVNLAYGISGSQDSQFGRGVVGRVGGNQGTGVVGETSGHFSQTAVRGDTVFGVGEGIGVHGKTFNGAGVRAEATGPGGLALQVFGPAAFTQSGRVNFATGQASLPVPVSNLRATSIVLATIQSRVTDTYVIGAGVQTANSRIVIHLNKAAPKALTVGWFVLNPP